MQHWPKFGCVLLACSLALGANAVLGTNAALGAAEAPAAEVFERTVQPILQRRCVMCHGEAVASAGVRLDSLSSDVAGNRRAAETWHDALNALNRGEMPPNGAPELTGAEREALVGWLTAELRKAAAGRRAAGGAAALRRLNRFELQRTMRDLLGLDVDYVRNLPPDERSREGFLNNGEALQLSALQIEYFLDAARGGLARAIVEGPPPRVFEHHAEQTVQDKVDDILWSNRLNRTGTFVARVPDFPQEGEFVLRLRARAELPSADAPFPRLEVTLGYRADTQTPARRVGIVDVKPGEAQTFELRGRLEEFPLQSRTQSKYPGLLIWARNVYSDGKPAPVGRKVQERVDGKNAVRWEWDDDPSFPTIVVESVHFKAPHYVEWPPLHHTRLIPETPTTPADEDAAARKALRGFLARAYRRPARESDIETSMRYFERVRPTVPSFEQAMRDVFAMALVSPDFLYLVETPKDDAAGLNDHELAARLSYFLWSTTPDEELRALADQGRLRQPAVLEAQTQRLLRDSRSWAFIEQFSDGWLDLPGVERVAVNPTYYPDFDPLLASQMRLETQHFFAEVLRENLDALTLLRADFTMANERLARHYGLAGGAQGPRGGAFERVELAGARPGGLLGHGSILLANSTGEDSHPIERGVWVRQALLDDPPAPPPPAVPNLDGGEQSQLLPLKVQLERHRDSPACAQCHRGIDPWGIALEEMDAVGRIRDTIVRRSGGKVERHPVDAAATLPDGRRVNGVRELADYLHDRRGQDFRGADSQAAQLRAGALVGIHGSQTVDDLTARFIAGGRKLPHLITIIVADDSFQGR